MQSKATKRARTPAAAAALAQQEDDLPVAESTMPALADEIRASLADQANAVRFSSYVDAQLKKLPESELVRFEFFIRSHFNRGAIKRVMQAEVDKVRALSAPLLQPCPTSPLLILLTLHHHLSLSLSPSHAPRDSCSTSSESWSRATASAPTAAAAAA